MYINQAVKLRRWVTPGHHFPGRIRLKYKSGIAAQLLSFKSVDVEKALATIPAFKNFNINRSTGSIVIEYDASIIQPEWINALFSGSDAEAEEACYQLARQLELEEVNHE